MRSGLDHVIGHDAQMRRIFDVIDSVADTKATVLVTGESGTGKELVARAIHRLSPRAEQAFVAINCGAITEQEATDLTSLTLEELRSGSFVKILKNRQNL